jgi:hypothetical protein
MSKLYRFPDDNVDPKVKNQKDWCLNFCKAAWTDSEQHLPSNVFYKGSDKYDRTNNYMLGQQPIDDYKKALRVDESDDTTMFPMDFSILKVVPNRIQVMLGKLKQRTFNIHAQPIDALAKDELDLWFAEKKAMLMMREKLEATNPELLQSPELMLEPGDPQDMEELEIEVEYGSKRKRSKEAEMAIKFAFFANRVPEVVRPEVLRNIVYHGWGIYRDDLGKDNKPKIRSVDPRRFITNFCRRSDMSDMKFAGEVYEVTFEEFEVMADTKYSQEQREEIIAASVRHWGGATTKTYDGPNSRTDESLKVKLLDLTWYSTDKMVFEDTVNKYGNPAVVQAPFDAKGDKYKRKTVRNIYQGKWVIGTDIIIDYGLMKAQKRSPNNLFDCSLPYHVFGVDVHEMSTLAFGESLIPLADAIQTAWMKIQSIRNQMIPNGFDIDLDALEDATIGKGGKAMGKKELLDFFFQTGILLSRRKDISERNVNYQAIRYIENNYGKALAEAWNDLFNNVNIVREITGFNELTDASTPNPKTLVPVAKMAYEATNNALYGIMQADRNLLFSVAEASLIRVKQAIKRGGPIDTYVKSLGMGTIEHFQISSSILDREYAIMLTDVPTEEEKAGIMERLAMEEKKGTITSADIIFIKSIDNLKQAEEVLAHRIMKREKMMHQREMEKITANHKGQQESNQVAEALKTETLKVQNELDKDKETHKASETIRINRAKAEDQMAIDAAKPSKMGV